MSKVQAGKAITFNTEAAEIAGIQRATDQTRMDEAAKIARTRKADISKPGGREALYKALVPAFLAAGVCSTRGSAKAYATEWSSVIHALATGYVFENCASLRDCYKALPRKQVSRKSAGVKSSAYKQATEKTAEFMKPLNAVERGEFAERTIHGLSQGLKAKGQNRDNVQMGELLEFVLTHKDEVWALYRATAKGVSHALDTRKAKAA